MRFLADENISLHTVKKLKEIGLDTLSVRKLCPGLSDSKIIAETITQKRILITTDKDFGFWVLRRK